LMRQRQLNDASVLYGAQPEDGYPFIGYLMAEMKNGELGVCGINYIGPQLAITAAHCVEGANEVYPNIGEVTSAYKVNAFEVDSFMISPHYQGLNYVISAGEADVAIIKLAEPITLSQYATFGTPTEGCGYYITGYGRNEDGQTYERKG